MRDQRRLQLDTSAHLLFSVIIAFAMVLFLTLSCSKSDTPKGNSIRYALVSVVPSLDPHTANNTATAEIVGNIYETLLTYHYLKRPYSLEPLLADGMPTFDRSGTVLTVKLKKGVLFHDDASFPGGVGREVTADDVIYAIKRVANVKTKSNNYWLYEKRIKGLDDFRAYTQTTDQPDMSRPVEGLKKIDSHTVEIHLTQKDPIFTYVLAYHGSAIVPREAVEKYGDDFQNRAIGTGPFVLKSFGSKTGAVLEKNPKYRQEFYPSEGSAEDRANGLLADAGKRLPFVDRVELPVVVEAQPRMLQFLSGESDWTAIDKDNFADIVSEDLKLRPKYADQGYKMYIEPGPDIGYMSFNLKDPFLKKNKKVREAIVAALDWKEINRLIYSGRQILNCDIIPPTIAGHRPCKEPNRYNPERSKQLLKEAGFPEGKGLPKITIEFMSTSSDMRQQADFWKQSFSKVGLGSVEVELNTWAKFLEKKNSSNFQIAMSAWVADYPDAENFMVLLSSKSLPPGPNESAFSDARYDELFEKIRVMTPGPKRDELLNEMRTIIDREMPLAVFFSSRRFGLNSKRLRNFKRHMLEYGVFKYLKVEDSAGTK